MTHRDDDDEAPAPHTHGDGAVTEVDCRRLANLIGDYVDEQLPASMKTAVDTHMSQCAPCMAFLRQYRFAPEAARKVLLRQVPVDLESRLLSFLKGKCQGKSE
jgi:hypothetical protein